MSYEAKLSLVKQWDWELKLLVEAQRELNTEGRYRTPLGEELQKQITVLIRKLRIAKEDLNLDPNEQTV